MTHYFKNPIGKPGGTAKLDAAGKLLDDSLKIGVPGGLAYLSGTSKLLDDFVPTNVAKWDGNSKIPTANLYTSGAGNPVVADANQKIPAAMLYLGGAGGLVTFDDAAKVALDNLYVGVASGLVVADTNAKIAETILYDWMINKVGYTIQEYSASPPSHFLLCNGAYLRQSDYPSLWSVVGDRMASPYATVQVNSNEAVDCATFVSLRDANDILAVQFAVNWHTYVGGTVYYAKYVGGSSWYVYSSYANAQSGTGRINPNTPWDSSTWRPATWFKLSTQNYSYVRYE